MSVEYFYENDLNMLYNAAVNNNPDGGEHHTKMLESYNNLVTYISHIEHWKSTALQLAKNYGVRIHSLEQHIAELEVQLKSKDIIINNQQGRLNYYATKDLLGGKNEQ